MLKICIVLSSNVINQFGKIWSGQSLDPFKQVTVMPLSSILFLRLWNSFNAFSAMTSGVSSVASF